MAKIEKFEDLIVWQKGLDLSEAIHRAVETFPKTEIYALGSQLRRASSSIPANVAEGFSRRSRGAYRAHVSIALGSNAELRTHIELARRLGLFTEAVAADFQERAAEVGRLLYGLWRALTIKAVCYAVSLTVLLIGLWPWALGLFHASVLVAQP